MRMNTDCLSRDLAWQRRYFFSWIALVAYGCFAFALGDTSFAAFLAQGVFFLAAFSVTLWPICASFQADCDSHGKLIDRRHP